MTTIKIPPTSVDIDADFWHHLNTHSMSVARERFQEEYVEWGLRPVVRDGSVALGEGVVVFAVLLGISEIEVYLDDSGPADIARS